MKRMPYKQLNKLIQRLIRKGYYIAKPHRRGRRGFSDWLITRHSPYLLNPRLKSRNISFSCPTQADFIRAARHLLDGGPRPHKTNN